MLRSTAVALGLLALIALRATPTPPIEPRADRAAEPATVGTSSCSARSCHGGAEPLTGKRIRQDEYSVWSDSDPHSQSKDVLKNDLSNVIVTRLHYKPADQEPRCLACHSQTRSEQGLVKVENVGCESCHGPASTWLEPHQVTGWRASHPAAAQSLLDVTDLAAIARKCVGCHIGSPTSEFPEVPRDMNHDMIASGHPRLNFEFAGYYAQLNPHWNEKALPIDFARAWTVGQAVSADAALKLLEHRIQQKSWPELAEYACYTCHHSVKGPKDWRQERSQSLGKPVWGTWYFTALPAIKRDVAEPLREFKAVVETRPSGDSLRAAIEKLAPFIKNVVQEANTKSVSPADIVRALHDAAKNDWDGAAQLYLALAALSSDSERKELRKAWEALRDPSTFDDKLAEMLKSAGAK